MTFTSRPRDELISFETALKTMMHVFPVGLIQVTDYASDIIVVFNFWEQDEELGLVALGFIVASAVASWILILASGLPWSVQWKAMVLAPFNLHILHVGWLYTTSHGTVSVAKESFSQSEEAQKAQERKDEAQRNSNLASAELGRNGKEEWTKKWEAAALELRDKERIARTQPGRNTRNAEHREAEKERIARELAQAKVVENTCRLRMEEAEEGFFSKFEAVRRADAILSHAQKHLDQFSQPLQTKMRESSRLYELFGQLKAAESVLESLPLAIITAGEIISGRWSREDDVAVLESSLALSICSLTYGLFCLARYEHRTAAKDSERQDPAVGRQTKIFACMLVQVCWTVVAIGGCYSAAVQRRGLSNYVVIFIPSIIQILLCMFQGSTTTQSTASNLLSAPIFGFVATPIDYFIVYPADANKLHLVTNKAFWMFIVMPVGRRLALSSVAQTVLDVIDYSNLRLAYLLGVGFLLDLAAGVWTWSVVTEGSVRPQSLTSFSSPAEKTPAQIAAGVMFEGKDTLVDANQGKDTVATDEIEIEADSEAGRTRAAEEGVELWWQERAMDLLKSVIKHVQRVQSPCVNVTADRLLESLRELQHVAVGLKEQYESLSCERKSNIEAAIDNYMPSDDGIAEEMLTKQLSQRLQVTAKPQKTSAYVHPLHGARLQYGLVTNVWTTVPSFFGTKSVGTNFDFSFPTSSCTYFVSHAWIDDGKQKVAMLREFLCLHALLGRTVVVSLLLAIFSVPLGLSLESQWDAFGWWVPSFLMLAVLAVLLVWVLLSIHGSFPSAYTPWAFSSTTIWIDKLCIDQSTEETKQGGVESFPMVLANCEHMVALISEGYFTRLWCVYELANFARFKPEALLLFSLDWPNSIYPFKQAKLTAGERDMLANFSCENSNCFVPRDRVTVMREIRRNFGSEHAFDDYVHTELPQVLERSKTMYQSQMFNVGAEAFELAFGN